MLLVHRFAGACCFVGLGVYVERVIETSDDATRADVLGAALADAQRGVLGEIAALEAVEATLFAQRMRLRARVDELWIGALHEQEQFAMIELAGTARIGQSRAMTQLSHGTRLVTMLPRTLASLEAGRMFSQGALQLLELTQNCTAQVTTEVERRVLPVIEQMNTIDARRLILQTIPEVEADLDPELTQQRLDEAANGRRVWMREMGDGLVEVGAGMDALEARRWSLDFDELVRAQRVADRKAGIVRTADQRRAAVFAQLPCRLIALVRAIQQGTIGELLAIAQADPRLAEQLEALAAAAPPAATGESGEADEPGEAEEATGAEGLTLELRPVRARGKAMTCDPARPTADPRGLFDCDVPPFEDLPAPLGAPTNRSSDQPQDSGAELCPDAIPEEPPPHPDRSQSSRETERLLVDVLSLELRDPKVLNLHMQATTALELDNRVASIDGLGLLPAQRVRQFLPSITLRRILVDPDSGVPIAVDPTLHQPPTAARARPRSQQDLRQEHLHPDLVGSDFPPNLTEQRWARLAPLLTPYLLTETAQTPHDPSPSLREFIQFRDQRCTGIGCSLPASRCHLDHETAYPEGPTAVWNLGAKSARCHRAKHAGWTVSRPNEGPGSATITWTSPLGHSYTRPTRWTTIP